MRFNALERIFRVSSDTLLGWPLEVKKIEMAHIKQNEAFRRRCRQRMEEGTKRLREINILKCETQETICYSCSCSQRAGEQKYWAAGKSDAVEQVIGGD